MPHLIPDDGKNHDFRAFIEVCDAWGLTGNERSKLVRAATSSLSRWNHDPDKVGLDQDQHERVKMVLTIHEILWQIFEDQAAINEFLNGKLPYHPFNYHSIFDYILKDGSIRCLYETERWLRNTAEQDQQ